MKSNRDIYASLRFSMTLDEAKSILGFPFGYVPTSAEVTKAYKKKTLENHPDRGGNPRKMVEVNVAKDVLDGKSRRDFIPQKSEEEDDRRTALLKDLAIINKAKAAAIEAMDKHSLSVFEFRSSEPFRVFLLDQLADILDLIHDHAEKGLKNPSSKEDEKALKEVLSLIKGMNDLTIRIASKYRGLSNRDGIMLSLLEERYARAESVLALLKILFAKSRELNRLMMTGLGPHNDDAISIPEFVLEGYIREGHSGLEYYLKELTSFDPKDVQVVLKKVEEVIEPVLEILKNRKITPKDFDIPTNWKQWDIPDSFDLALTAVQRSVKNASQDVASKVAARFLAQS
jgi:hypothetical protein